METVYKKTLSLILIGLTGVGKSRLGNKLSGKKEFLESDGPDSCTKNIQKVLNQFSVEIIDSQGLSDTDKEDKNAITSIFNTIKENKPNILAYVQKAADHRFGESSKKSIQEICKMFDTKSVWNHFIIIFTYANCISKKNREKYASDFSNSILKVLKEYYEHHKINDGLPIPKKLKYYFVELGDDDEYQLDKDTVNNLEDIMKLIALSPPISSTTEKIIVEIKTKRNCQESIKIYDRMIEDKYGGLKKVASNFGIGCGFVATEGVGILGGIGLEAISMSLPLGLAVGAFYGTVIYFLGAITYQGLKYKFIDGVDFYHKADDKSQNEDYITFDEETYIYHDGSTEIKRINIDYFTRIISK
jgi:hypothetical protein